MADDDRQSPRGSNLRKFNEDGAQRKPCAAGRRQVHEALDGMEFEAIQQVLSHYQTDSLPRFRSEHVNEAQDGQVKLPICSHGRSPRSKQHRKDHLGCGVFQAGHEQANHGDDGRECLEHLDEGHGEVKVHQVACPQGEAHEEAHRQHPPHPEVHGDDCLGFYQVEPSTGSIAQQAAGQHAHPGDSHWVCKPEVYHEVLVQNNQPAAH
mmetsp:Transcript_19109/g.53473  ORF Transcript_19109/g.53473 Transcript_19109/m.53473 type:complete len:208 (+) Transcript_19109:575-1198(+)